MQRPTTTKVACLKALTLLPLLFSTVPGAHAQLPSNVFRRVLMIQAGESAGTGFTIDVDGRQYLITAKHVVSSLKPEDTILVRKGDDWDRVTVKIFRCDDPIDIAVLVPPSQLTVSFPLEPTMTGLRYGQDMYFAGFPYGLLFMDGKNVNGLYPIPFLKKAIMSASTNVNGAKVIFLDGHNNPGFSGGPIVYRDLDRRDFVYKVAGVVSAYRPELIPVVTPEEIEPGEDTTREEEWRIVRLKSGHLVRLKDTDQMVPTNSGIVIGYSITHAVELIRKHPIGPKVAE